MASFFKVIMGVGFIPDKPEIRFGKDNRLIFSERHHTLQDILEGVQENLRNVPLEMVNIEKPFYADREDDLILQEIKIPALSELQEFDDHYSWRPGRSLTLRQVLSIAQAQNHPLDKARLCWDWVSSDYHVLLYK